jgi:hypothetical protein
VPFGSFSGARLTAGGWFDPYQVCGIEGSGFFLLQRSIRTNFASNPSGKPLLAIPFFNTVTNAEDVAVFANSNKQSGQINVESTLRLLGSEANLLINLYRDRELAVTLLGGFRFLDLREALQIGGSSTALSEGSVFFLGTAFPAPAATFSVDEFHTRNQFYGGQLGVQVEYRCNRASLLVTGKLALGGTTEAVDLIGRSALFSAVYRSSDTSGDHDGRGTGAVRDDQPSHGRHLHGDPGSRSQTGLAIQQTPQGVCRLQLPLLEPRRPARGSGHPERGRKPGSHVVQLWRNQLR